ncbi:hypothetical protein H0H93_001091 [Arthromyces matolae]|nr:hypothetical protein H0H93_001091 [Arthromyces matolae]
MISLHEFHTRPAPEIPIDIIPFCENKDGHKFVDKKLLRQYEIEREGLTGAALVEWYDLKRSQCAAREEHAELCEEWNEDCNLRRTNKLNDLRSQRFEAIKAKLSELGWEAEIDHVENDNEYRKKKLSHHKLVKKPQSLTNRIWNNIKDDLIQFLTDHKAKRLEKLRGDVIRMRESVLDEVLVEFLDAYAVSQPLHAIFPPTVDLAILPLFRDIIEETPIEENVTKAHFQNAIRELPQTIELWRRAKDEMLLNLINDHPGTNEKATLATLQRATTLFRCRGRPISYPRILTHSCPGKILYDPVTSEKAMSILQECGLDPTMMSDALLMDSSLYFECLRCPTQRQERSRSIMKWPTVIEHVHDHHGPRAPYVIQRADLSSAERYLVEKLELIEKRRAFKENRYKSKLICRQCKSKLSWDRSFDHLKTHHPEILADDDTTWEYGNSSPERFMALGLDADASLCEPPVTFYPDLPFISIRRALQSEIPRRSDYQLDKQTQDLLASLPTDGSVNNLISPGFLSDPEFGL